MMADPPLVGAGAAEGVEEPVALTGGTGFVGSFYFLFVSRNFRNINSMRE